MNAIRDDVLPAGLPEKAQRVIAVMRGISGITPAEMREQPKRTRVARARCVLALLLYALTDLMDDDIATLIGSRESSVSRLRSWFVGKYQREPQKTMRYVGLLFPASVMLGTDMLNVIRENA